MSDSDNRNGVGPERLLAFSDGVFAIAITLLVLDLHVPAVDHGLLEALKSEWPRYISYVLSFILVGIIWAQHHYIFRDIARVDHLFLLINVIFLMWIALLPFPTAILGEYLPRADERQTAVAIYTGVFLVGSLLFNLLWRYAAWDARLMSEGMDRTAVRKVTRSYNVGPILYLVDFILAFISPVASLVLFALLAIFYAVSPLPIADRWLGRTSAERS